MDVLKTLSLAGLVPVIRVEDAADAVPLCRALEEGGLPVAEITFRTDAAEQAIRNVHGQLPGVILGAGTVLSVEQVRRAVDAGAAYIVSPGFNPEVVGYCVENEIPVLPGCATPSEVEQAMAFGLDTVKFFPAEALGGLKLIKAMSAPYGAMRFVPTGGINEKNVLEYLAFPKVCAVGGSWMVPGDAIKEKDWQRITDLTRTAVALMLGFELKHVGINCASPEESLKGARALAELLGWSTRAGNASNFAGDAFELMKQPGRGTHGHIAIAVNNLVRARWHLEKRGYAFADETQTAKAVYLRDEIAGFALHLLQK